MRMKKTAGAKKRALKGSPKFTGALGTPVMVMLVLAVMGAAIVIASWSPLQTADAASVDGQSRRSIAARGESNGATASSGSGAAPRASDAVASTGTEIESANAAAAAKLAPVTITGCLEVDQETFRLKNATGQDAPKARSWKSGFIKKAPATIEVVDASRKLKLSTHVGQRVSATGVLVGREMQVRSLQRVASTCNQKS